MGSEGNIKRNGNILAGKLQSRPEEFIPYACHLDSHTLITKDGKILQVIKIPGNNPKKNSIRENLRKTIDKNIKSDDFSLSFHNIKSKVTANGRETGHYENNIYVTILNSTDIPSHSNFGKFLKSLKPSSEFGAWENSFKSKIDKLNEVTKNIISDLQEYDAKKLGLRNVDQTFFSEPLEFLTFLANFSNEDMPVIPTDISGILLSSNPIFGHNTIACNNNLAAILTVKEYHEIPEKHLAKLLDLPHQFIISEIFNFITNKEMLNRMGKRIFMQKMAGDKIVGEASGLAEMADYDKSSTVNFGEHQISLTIIEKSFSALEDATNSIISSLRELGIVLVREDIFMEDCYFSQLPANFVFLKRLSPLSAKKIAGYCVFGSNQESAKTDKTNDNLNN